ncbi:MAG TPA: hypothetical protein VEI58_09155, partial [Chthoniobacterales bacterium]|nr:hypothetical protein [Chthoniobacterales bacterium]
TTEEISNKMKRVIVSIACCVLITPLALAKDSSKQKRNQTTGAFATVIERGVTVSATIVDKTPEAGEAANYQPPNTLVVRPYGTNDIGRYVLDGPGRVVNQKGEIVRSAIKPGTHVRVYFASTGGVRTIDHVVVD